MSDSSICKAFQILDLLSEDQATITSEDVSDALGTSRSTTYRYIKSLCDSGFLVQFRRGVFALGPRIVELERKIQLSDPLLNSSRGAMRDSVDAFAGSALLLCGLWGDRVLCIHHAQSEAVDDTLPLEIERARGRPFPLFKGAASLAILAHLTVQKRRSIFLKYSREIADAGLGTTWQEFRQATRALRSKQHVVTRGTFGTSLVAVAAPILDEDGNVVGSITRILRDASQVPVAELSTDIRRITDAIETELGDRLGSRQQSQGEGEGSVDFVDDILTEMRTG